MFIHPCLILICKTVITSHGKYAKRECLIDICLFITGLSIDLTDGDGQTLNCELQQCLRVFTCDGTA